MEIERDDEREDQLDEEEEDNFCEQQRRAPRQEARGCRRRGDCGMLLFLSLIHI